MLKWLVGFCILCFAAYVALCIGIDKDERNQQASMDKLVAYSGF